MLFYLNFQYLSFAGHDEIPPSSFTDKTVAEKNSKDYMFMSCINHIHQVSV